jgi:predicted HTH domain antitoxin
MNTLTIELPFGVDPEEARLLLSMKLFEDGRITLGQAAAMAGYSRRTYIELLGRRGVPVFNYPAEDLDRELSVIAESSDRSSSDPPPGT